MVIRDVAEDVADPNRAAEAGVVGLGRLTLSRRERMVIVEPRGTRHAANAGRVRRLLRDRGLRHGLSRSLNALPGDQRPAAADHRHAAEGRCSAGA
jgi:hypothetical protein